MDSHGSRIEGAEHPATDPNNKERPQAQPDPSLSGEEMDMNPEYCLATDVKDITPAAALEILCTGVEMLSRPTVDSPSDSRVDATPNASYQARGDSISSGEITPIRVTELHCSPAGYDEVGRYLMQQSMLSKRFLSKREPPITLKDYLLRLHRYCPMSTAVYLATNMYITRMVTVDRVILVTPKNIHRLVLAGLRVAMKTLEDLSYPHSRVAKVGGVTERELSKLEISFCFLADFELRVDARMLIQQVAALERNIGPPAGILIAET